MINLFYLSGNTTGGWVTFTAHLHALLELYGEEVRLFKIGNRDEASPRPFGYGVSYHNITLDTAVNELVGEKLITASSRNFQPAAKALIQAGARTVLHDPTELRAGLADIPLAAPWVIRRAVAAQVPGSVFMRHPYLAQADRMRAGRGMRKGAVAISRIDFDKHTDMILDANRLGAGIRIHGFENRLYTKFKIMPKYPEWEQSKAAYDRDHKSTMAILQGAKYMVDMSEIKGDGGGTQYTFLQAWDALTVPVIGSWWVRKNDDMIPGKNCIAVANAEELAKVTRGRGAYTLEALDDMRAAGAARLRLHGASALGPKIMEWLHADR